MRSFTPSGLVVFRADDWICTSINRFTRAAPSCFEPRRQMTDGVNRRAQTLLRHHKRRSRLM